MKFEMRGVDPPCRHLKNTEMQKHSFCLCALRPRGLRVNGGGEETQRISIYPDIRTKHLSVEGENKNTEIRKHSFCLCTLRVF